MTTNAYWASGWKRPRFPRLDKNCKVDVAVIGAGITGVTTAYMLKQAGCSVALLERDRCGGVDTGHTTAHLTYVTDLRLHELDRYFGSDHAQAAWDAGQAAMNQIDEIVQNENIACEFRWVPGYLHASLKNAAKGEDKLLQRDAELAKEMGFDARFMASIPLVQQPGIRFANQAKFHPLKYLAGLLERLPGKTCHVFENTEVEDVQDDPLALKANGHAVTCDYVVLATHVPLMGKTGLLSATLFQTKLASYSSYALGAKVARGTLPEALFWDTSDPYYYVRVERLPKHDYVIFGGEDHKTGQENDTEACLGRLEETLATYVSKATVDRRWSGQVIETNDGLPLIGETAAHQFAATGFGGNGMTFGTLGAMMARDAFLGHKNPWKELFDVGRKKLRGGTWNYIKENVDYPYYYLKDRLTGVEGTSLRGVKQGEGKILKVDGQRVAAYRSPEGKVTTVSANCTHMGCLVRWNSADTTWDCPCHGSRFKPTGEVLAGPAETPLDEVKTDSLDPD